MLLRESITPLRFLEVEASAIFPSISITLGNSSNEYEIYRRPDLVDVYNSVNPIDEIKKLGYHLRGIKTAINNTTKAIGKGTTPELEDKLKTLTADRDIVEARIHDLRAQQKTMTESDRKAVCRELEKFLKDAKNCEAKQYIRTTIDEILVSNESIQLTINAA